MKTKETKEAKPKEDAKKCHACGGTPEFRDIVKGEIVDVCKTCIKPNLDDPNREENEHQHIP